VLLDVRRRCWRTQLCAEKSALDFRKLAPSSIFFLGVSGDRIGILGGAHDEEPEGEPVDDHRFRQGGDGGYDSRCSCCELIGDAASGRGPLLTVDALVLDTKIGARM
jgi:hypothetical protein